MVLLIRTRPTPPRTRVEQEHPVTCVPRKGTVMDIPIDSSQSDETKRYLVQFDDSTVLSVPLAEMPDMVLNLPTPPCGT